MQVDTGALLKSLKELETQFSSYQRQDAIPLWAMSILPRLDLLEASHKDSSSLHVKTLKELDQEDELIEKIRHEVDVKTSAMKLAFEAKTSSTSLEIDRLHKLLYIRPTTSELQHVVMQLQQVRKQTDGVLLEVTGDIQTIVNQKLAEEMLTLMDRLKATEDHSDKSAAMVLQRVEELDGELRKVRGGVQAEFATTESSIGGIMTTTSDIQTEISGVKATIQLLNDETKESLKVLTRGQDLTNETLDEFTKSTTERLEVIVENIATCDDLIKEQTERSEERDDALAETIQRLSESFDDFKLGYEDTIDQLKANQSSLSLLLQKTVDRQNVLVAYMESLQAFDVTNRITANSEQLAGLREETGTLEENLNTLRVSVSDINREQVALIREVEEIPGKINAEAIRIDATMKEVRQAKDVIKYLKTTMQDHSNQIEDLCLLKEQMVVVRDVCESQDERMKKILRTVGDVAENSEVQEKRIDEMVTVIQASEDKTYNRISATKRVIEELFTQQLSEMESKLQVVKDTVTILQAGGATKKTSTSQIKAPAASSPSAERVLQMVEEEAKGGNPLDDTIEKIFELVDLCNSFEEIAVYRSAVPKDIPSSLCGELANAAQSMAALIASKADSLVIQHIIRGEPLELGPEDPVSEKRAMLMERALSTLRMKLQENYPNPNALRLEARDMFVTRFNHAFQLAMSKHDQVSAAPHPHPPSNRSPLTPCQIIATGTSRLGRIKIPSCIACDRPLVSKVHPPAHSLSLTLSVFHQVLRDTTVPPAQRPRSPLAPLSRISSQPSWPPDDSGPPHNSSQQLSASLSLDDSWPGSHSLGGAPSSLRLSEPIIVPSTSGHRAKTSGGLSRGGNNNLQENSLSSSTGGSQYVLRGGFKMPRQGSAGGQIPHM
jgi:hypothetical protein